MNDTFQPKRLACIKSKKVRELASLRRQIFALQEQLKYLQQPRPSTLLPWRDVTAAIHDDTVAEVQVNTTLRRRRQSQARLCEYLQQWIASMGPDRRAPSAFLESWRHSHLFAGDDIARTLSYTWLLRQVYESRHRAFAHLRFPTEHRNDIDVCVTCDDDRLQIHVQTQQVLPYSLENVSRGLWIAQETLCQEYFAAPDDPTALLSTPTADVQYTRENVGGSAPMHMVNNVLTGRFYEPNAVVLCLRSVLSDDLFPTATSTWRFDNKEWTVAERLGPQLTRCRTVYTIDHPCTAAGFVSLKELAALRQLPSDIKDPFVLEARLKQVSVHKHVDQRQFFMRHLERTLDAIARHAGPVPQRGVLVSSHHGTT
ncbi:hypothetical protein ACHHYP_15169 [Achlya hypogyna]|uniref:Uncharacterized protein n=1 Tax=Achlya hypogyna TaxID=1202772 RepID=A0A1V9YBD9_ACHHY|nr:hypothetical protein ACHHYP_15169 [Achlya hypogyna]